MNRKLIILVLAGLIIYGLNVKAAFENWGTDFVQAQKAAAEKKQPILAFFAGSDWCDWCIALDKEVFSTDEFKKYAKENLILFLADFPNSSNLPEKTEKQNKELAEKYKVIGPPTVLILDANGKVLAKTGYREGGAVKYVEHIKSLIKKQKATKE